MSKKPLNQGDVYDWFLWQNRKFWILGICVISACAVTLYVSLATLWRPVPVVVFDSSGKPILFRNTNDHTETLTDVRLSYFVKDFTQKWVGIDSGTLTRDFADALNMMTPELRQITETENNEGKRRSKYINANITTKFSEVTLKSQEYDPNDPSARITGYIWGTLNYEPKVSGSDTGSEPVSQYFLSAFIVQRTPVTESKIHGLAVEYFETHLFDSKSDFENHVLKKMPKKEGA